MTAHILIGKEMVRIIITYDSNKHFTWRYTNTPVKFSSLKNSMHYDSSFVATYFINGSGYAIVEGNTVSFGSGDILIISPNEFHRCFVDASDNHERITIYINTSILEGFSIPYEIAFGAFLDHITGCENVIPSNIVRKLGINKIFSEFKMPAENNGVEDAIMQCRAIELLLRLRLTIHQDSKPIKNNATVEKAITYINNHLEADLSTEALSKLLSINKSYLCRIFKTHTGATVNEYVTEKRVNRAKELLLEGKNCTDACYESGFNNYTSFYHFFLKYIGRSPMDFYKQ